MQDDATDWFDDTIDDISDDISDFFEDFTDWIFSMDPVSGFLAVYLKNTGPKLISRTRFCQPRTRALPYILKFKALKQFHV